LALIFFNTPPLAREFSPKDETLTFPWSTHYEKDPSSPFLVSFGDAESPGKEIFFLEAPPLKTPPPPARFFKYWPAKWLFLSNVSRKTLVWLWVPFFCLCDIKLLLARFLPFSLICLYPLALSLFFLSFRMPEKAFFSKRPFVRSLPLSFQVAEALQVPPPLFHLLQSKQRLFLMRFLPCPFCVLFLFEAFFVFTPTPYVWVHTVNDSPYMSYWIFFIHVVSFFPVAAFPFFVQCIIIIFYCFSF